MQLLLKEQPHFIDRFQLSISTTPISISSEIISSIVVNSVHSNNLFSVGADFLSTVYTYHLQYDDNEADWNRMYNYYRIAVSPQEQTRALVAISATSNTTRLIQ